MLTFIKKLFGGSSVNFKKLVKTGAVIVDVRSASEYKAGHIPAQRTIRWIISVPKSPS